MYLIYSTLYELNKNNLLLALAPRNTDGFIYHDTIRETNPGGCDVTVTFDLIDSSSRSNLSMLPLVVPKLSSSQDWTKVDLTNFDL